MDIQQFEKELVTKLQFKASSRIGVETVLLKIFKFFDLNNEGYLKKQEFLKAIAKAGVTIPDQEFGERLWMTYSFDEQLYYKDFINRVVGKQQIEEQAESRIVQTGSPLEQLRLKLQLKGALGILNLAISLPNQFTAQQLQDYLKRNNIEVDGLYQLFNGEYMSASNLINQIKGQYLNQSRQGVVSDVFYTFEQREISPQQLVNRFNAERHPEIKILNRSPNDVREEFLSGLSVYLQLRGIKMLTIQDFFDFYSYFGFYLTNDEIFKTILVSVWDLNQLQQQALQYGTPPQSIKQQQLNYSPQQQNIIANPQIVQQLNFSPSQDKSVKSYQQNQQQLQERQSVPKSVKSHQSNASQMSSTSRQVELIVQRIRNRLISRGARGFIQLYRVGKILDSDHDGMLNLTEFRKAIRDHKIEVTDPEIDIVFQYFDREQSGLIDLWGFMFVLRGEMSQLRTQLVEQLFEKYRTNDYVSLQTLRNNFICRNHPDLKNGKKSDDEIIQDFFEPLQLLHNINGGFGHENITKEELLEFFSNYSASIPDDKYFEQIIVNVFRLLQDGSKNHYAGNKQVFEPDHKRGYLQDHHRFVLQGGSVSANAPFGTFTQQEQLAQSRPSVGYNQPASFNIFKPLEDVKVNQNGSQIQQIPLSQSQISQQSQQQQQYEREQSVKSNKQKMDNIQILRNKISQRGLRGLINIQYRFQLYDKSHLNALSYQEWKNCFKQWRLDISEQILDDIFQQFQTNGMMNYSGFIKQIQGTMSLRKFNAVQQAFESLPKTTIDIVKQQFNAKDHPDVRANRKREDDVLCEFIDTFEQHHIVFTGGDYVKNPNVTFEEFIGYYNNLNLLIEDDIQFEQHIQSVWNLRRRL
ncbi:unnamed protein product [Paramecium primaurelia]|uniref:EF-hand domain-containing protein n=1 Tax=Paramecium primaurelia TaxID=5886 RepID=A0A8S1MDH5_PARPR|nr:unnamed protein product [Paramecium primaurelia]